MSFLFTMVNKAPRAAGVLRSSWSASDNVIEGIVRGGGGSERGSVVTKRGEGFLGGVEGIEGEVELLARVAGEERVAERHRAEAFGFEVVERVEVAERLGHLLAVHEEVLAMIPVV